MIERLTPASAPVPRGPYSPAMRVGDFIFVSGQGPIDPATNTMSFGDIRHETRLVLRNVRAVLEAAGAAMTDIVKCNVFLADAADFPAMNEAYVEYFTDHLPARTTVQTRFVVLGMKVEIDAVAYKPFSF